MSQKEDILEQIVEEYLTHKGYFVQRNIKYRPDRSDLGYDSQKDSVHSDIDVLAYNPLESGAKKVLAVNIKSWQGGFDFRVVLEQVASNKIVSGRESHLRYRELCIPKWSNAFSRAIRLRTKESRFTHVLAVTLAKGDASQWIEHEPFTVALGNNPLEVLTLRQMVDAIEPNLTTTPAATDIGRTLQLFRAAGLRPKAAKPEVGLELDGDSSPAG
jgi:hypothetical protein